MSSAVRDLLEQAKTLPHDERHALALAILDTLESEPASPSPEWTAKINSRLAQIERREVEVVPWSEVEARVRRTLERDAGALEVPEDFDEPLSGGSRRS